MIVALGAHTACGAPDLRSWVVDFRGHKVKLTAGDQHPTVVEQARTVGGPGLEEISCGLPPAKRGVVKFSGSRKAVPTGNEYFPAVQKRSCVEAAGPIHAASAAPSCGGRIIHLGGCEH